jgi:hypothetical protein
MEYFSAGGLTLYLSDVPAGWKGFSNYIIPQSKSSLHPGHNQGDPAQPPTNR